MVLEMKCDDCGKEFSMETKSVNELGMVLDVQCECGSFEVNLKDGHSTPLPILPPHLMR